MEKIRQITIRLSPHAMNFVIGTVLAIAAYIMALLMPDCHDCKPSEIAFIQLVHGIFTVGMVFASFAFMVRGIIIWAERD